MRHISSSCPETDHSQLGDLSGHLCCSLVPIMWRYYIKIAFVSDKISGAESCHWCCACCSPGRGLGLGWAGPKRRHVKPPVVVHDIGLRHLFEGEPSRLQDASHEFVPFQQRQHARQTTLIRPQHHSHARARQQGNGIHERCRRAVKQEGVPDIVARLCSDVRSYLQALLLVHLCPADLRQRVSV